MFTAMDGGPDSVFAGSKSVFFYSVRNEIMKFLLESFYSPRVNLFGLKICSDRHDSGSSLCPRTLNHA